jgi:cation:H+ antiporter
MMIPSIAVVVGVLVLVWSANRFVDGASALAYHFGMSPLLIGMVVVGFGTSSPELVVSVQAAIDGVPAIALGNAYGSNIANIALILGITSIIMPITVRSKILKMELPLLAVVTGVSAYIVSDGYVSRLESVLLLMLFSVLMGWSLYRGRMKTPDTLGDEVAQELKATNRSLKQAVSAVIVGLVLLVLSSRSLVWGAVEIAQLLGMSDLVIGLTIVAIGTSLPELASAVAATKRGEHDLALGNVLGSNLFNTLAVVGLSGVIHPIRVESQIFTRDMMVMSALTVSLFIIGYRFPRGKGRINRFEGVFLVLCYVGYTALLFLG